MKEVREDMSNRLRVLRKPVVAFPLGLIAAGTVAVLLALFQPWTLFVDRIVNDEIPITRSTDPAPSTPTSPEVLVRGSFISHEHATTGSVVVLRLPDGGRVLRIEDLDTSNGPDLHVWITDAPVIPGLAGWKVFDDGKYVSLGKLQGNKGSQNYELPDSVNLEEFTSVSIWCKRFAVSFGAAELKARTST